MKGIHLPLAFCLLVAANGCFSNQEIPVLRPAVEIIVTIEDYPDHKTKDFSVRANPAQFDAISEFTQPHQEIEFYRSELFSEVNRKRADETHTVVFVREFGTNPVVASLDDEHEYLAKGNPKALAGIWKLVGMFREKRPKDEPGK